MEKRATLATISTIKDLPDSRNLDQSHVPCGDGGRQLAVRRLMSASRELFLVGAGALAGLVGTAGGITSLVSYPALLWAGVPPLQANIANLVALVACWPGSAVASRPELRGRGPWLRRWSVIAAAGGAAGSVLLLVTPSGVFGRVVPFLVAAGSLALVLQPRIAAARPSWQAADGADRADRADRADGADRADRRPRRELLLLSGLLALSCYNGYFGAGSGVLLLALLLLTTDPHLATANALKNMVVGAATITSAVLFAIVARVDWAAVGPLAAGMLAGSLAGPWVARRLPPGVLRWLAAGCGLVLAVRLWI
jgi:uncharacterized protein